MSYVGRTIYGFCDGYFGRDHYEPCRIEAEGADWIVVRGLGENDKPEFASFRSVDKKELLSEWTWNNG